MMADHQMIEDWIDAVCTHAGWSRPYKNREDQYRFRLDNGLVVDAGSPDDRTLVLKADIAPLSRDNRDHLIRRAASAVVPRTFTDHCVVSLDPMTQTLCLHAQVTLGALRASQFPEIMENFINDLAFYRSL